MIRNRSVLISVALVGVFFYHGLAIESLQDIKVGGVYRMELTTGDILEGIVETKNDTALIIECEGKPYTFHAHLIFSYALISSPPEKKSDMNSAVLSYDQLLHRKGNVGTVEITLHNGSTFRGLVSEIDSEMVKIDVQGSLIPMTREVIGSISRVNAEDTNNVNKKQNVVQSERGPFDTVYIKNSETDAWGNPLEPLLFDGTITSDNASGITLQTRNKEEKKFSRDRIIRVKKHSVDPVTAKIQRYAQPLFCSDNMILVDIPPGAGDRPFFKVCIDMFEFPNKKDAMPQTNVSFEEAKDLCRSVGKRLCSTEEWQWACSGLEEYTYPYGFQLDEHYCNRDGIEEVEVSGRRSRCYSKFGVYDMVGNVFEWVTDSEGKPMLMGGPLSKCQTISPGLNGNPKPQIGFRCCKSN